MISDPTDPFYQYIDMKWLQTSKRPEYAVHTSYVPNARLAAVDYSEPDIRNRLVVNSAKMLYVSESQYRNKFINPYLFYVSKSYRLSPEGRGPPRHVKA